MDGTSDVVTGQLRGVFEGARSFHGFADAFQVFDPAFLDRLAHQGGLFRRTFSHGVDQRQGRLALGQVVTDVLAQGFGVAAVIQQVVYQLEGYAQVIAEGAQGFALLGRRFAQGRGAVGRGFEEHRGFAANHFHVGLFGGAGVANLRQLQHFAFGDDARGL